MYYSLPDLLRCTPVTDLVTAFRFLGIVSNHRIHTAGLKAYVPRDLFLHYCVHCHHPSSG